jgi:hypothetical protein
MTVYLSEASTGTNATFTTVCAVSVDGGGVETSSETQEPCLDDTVIYEYPADPKYAQQTIEYKKLEPSASGTTLTTTTVSTVMEDAVLNGTLCSYAVKIPLATPVYATRTAYVISHTDMSKERNQDMKSSIVFAPQSAWTYSLTAPTT